MTAARPLGAPVLEALARRFGTPLYIYRADVIRDRVARLCAAFGPLLHEIHYSVKANSNLALLKLLADAGCGFDVVSGGELERCRRIGIDPRRIVFAGVGKTDAELGAALALGIGLFDVESTAELERLARLTEVTAPRRRPVDFALRLNPDVDAGTHAYVTTGLKSNKFGLPFEEALAAALRFAGHPQLHFRGFHIHIGSQVLEPDRFRAAAAIAADRVRTARAAGLTVDLLNLGGGFAAHYDVAPPPIEAVAAAVRPIIEPLGVELLLEPGRFLIAEAGTLLARVIAVKPAADRTFVIVDAAMNDLIRPALYGAFHPIELVAADAATRPSAIVDLVGPVCESGDFLAKERALPLPRPGELIAIGAAGAYGFSMASQYNSRPRAAEVLLEMSPDGGFAHPSARLIRRRETIDDLLAAELSDESPITL